jgi:ferredoxin
MDADEVPVTVRSDGNEETLTVTRGTNLRRALLDAGVEVYAPAARIANCGGRGICATCGVRVHAPDGTDPGADHWHDALAARYGYPRLSCQLTVEGPLVVELIEKRYWGQLLPDR